MSDPDPKVKQIEEQFDQLAKELLDRCEQIDCTIPEYIAGLKRLIATLQDSRLAAERAASVTKKWNFP